MIDQPRLVELAMRATSGPWSSGVAGVYQDNPPGNYVVRAGDYGPSGEDRMFIAAANPQAVIELLNELRLAHRVISAAERTRKAGRTPSSELGQALADYYEATQ